MATTTDEDEDEVDENGNWPEPMMVNGLPVGEITFPYLQPGLRQEEVAEIMRKIDHHNAYVQAHPELFPVT